jgi:type VI secretion system protein VasD
MTIRWLPSSDFTRHAAHMFAAAILLGSTGRAEPAADQGSAPPAKPEPFSIEATLVGGPNLNPNLEGHASPVVVRLFELKQTRAFEAASFDALFDRPQQALGADLLVQQEFVLRPGEIHHYDRAGSPMAAALGLAAAFRTPEKDSWRVIVPLAPGVHNLLLIDFDHNQIRVPSLPAESSGR